jgi:hypothetical protein
MCALSSSAHERSPISERDERVETMKFVEISPSDPDARSEMREF